jgi:hypothetical protein
MILRRYVPERPSCALALAVCTVLLLAPAGSASGQSTTRGTLEGTVIGEAGTPLPMANVWVTEVGTGVKRFMATDGNGRFRWPLLPLGAYDVLAEELGYQPKLIRGVPVRPGRRQTIAITLELVELPVNQVDEDRFRGLVEDSRTGQAQWLTPFEINNLPERRRELVELGRYSSVSTARLDTEGLPGWLSGIYADGVPYSAARHPDLPTSTLGTGVFPLSEFSSAELITNGLDVEWSGFAGGYLSGYSRRGTNRPELLLYGDWTGGRVTVSDYFSGNDLGTHSFRGGAVFTGPILRDTAHFVLGFEAQRLETPLPSPWTITTFDSALVAVARDSFDVVISAPPGRVVTENLGSAFGRFDWQVTENNALTLRGSLGLLERGGDTNDPRLGQGHIASLGSKVEGVNLSTGGVLASRISNVFSSELRLGIDRTQRDYKGTSLLGTRIVDGGLAFGTDPAVPGKFDRLTAVLTETLHFRLGSHQLKAGLGATYLSYEERYSWATGGEFAFAGVEEFAGLRGSFGKATGTAPFGKFRNWQVTFYLQDTWTPVPELDVLLGLRYEYEELDNAVRRNEDWLEQSGLDNSSFSRTLNTWSPRIGVRWDVGGRGVWLVRGGWGLYHTMVDPNAFGEVVTHDGRVLTRKGLGDLDAWPEVPSFDAAPLLGQRLSMLGPKFRGPRTSRVSLGVSRLFPDRTAVHLSGTYRFTDHLARRQDLNLIFTPTTADQYGRPVYGTLVQQGSLLAVDPGTNRRFEDFALVSALNADGVSSYWGGTLAFERHEGEWLDVVASYTYSWTQDNWLSGRGGGPEVQLTPFPDSLNRRDWTKGTSDFDAPHSLVVGAEVKVPTNLAGVRFGAYYRFRSGAPFTPGFRDAVDVNGDGSGRNDPAFIDDTIEDVDRLLSKWSCLADQVGRFAERNSCRGPYIHQLDARVAVGLYELLGHPIEIVVDALNLLEASFADPDRAVYLIDRNGVLETNPDGTITVPLRVNRQFGKPLVRYSTGRSLRFGIRMGL